MENQKKQKKQKKKQKENRNFPKRKSTKASRNTKQNYALHSQLRNKARRQQYWSIFVVFGST